MQQIEPLKYGKFYHIYNRGINSCDLFHENTNYEYFLKLYDKHISPVADTYAWVLMKNHFHLLVRIKEEVEIQPRTTNLTISPDRVPNPVRTLVPAKHFSNLFNSYAQAFNKMYGQHGNLFERPFKWDTGGKFEFTDFQGLASHGGAIGVLTAIILYCKKYHFDFLWVLDRVAIATPVTGAFIVKFKTTSFGGGYV
ncbi:MAG TPA: prolipoprotein diacylglyceryl transferase family protein [Prolixibacteraceae bacterium]|nr:prolipoprotein diacylglyceryl transferase family protein [Prolixibacteraceae bacterium]